MHPSSNRRRVLLPILALTVLAGLALQSACLGTARCDALRAELLQRRDGWTGCDPAQGDDQCAVVAGDGTDCTGVFRCSFAVNRVHRSDAEREVIANASESPVCAAVCSSPTCAQDGNPRCDPATHRCIVDVSLDAGTMTVADAAPPDEPGASDAASAADASHEGS